jgi:hypothetical protein
VLVAVMAQHSGAHAEAITSPFMRFSPYIVPRCCLIATRLYAFGLLSCVVMMLCFPCALAAGLIAPRRRLIVAATPRLLLLSGHHPGLLLC